jgi:polygalacturonase
MSDWKHCLAYLSAVAAIVIAPAVSAATPSALFNARSYGATGDGAHLDTAALNRAAEACAKAGGGTVIVPPGRYLTGTILLKSHVTLDIEGGATLLASQDPKDYPLEPDAWVPTQKILSPVIEAQNAENVTVTGRGEIDGQGAVWWRRLDLASPRKGMPGAQTPAEQADAAKVAHGRPQLIRFVNCRDVVIEDISLKDSPEWNIHPLFCEDVRVDGVTITAPPKSHNTDGIDPESCRNVQITNCRIDNGDDCVTLKSGLNEIGRQVGRPDEDITISNCVMLHGHGGVTIGSEMSGGVRNVAVTNCVFQGTDNGIRIKSERGRGGVVEGVTVSNIVMQDVPSPFTITTFYMGHDKPGDLYPVDAGTPRFRDFLFSDITARGAKVAGGVTGLREMPVGDMTFTNIHIQAATGFTCTNAQGIAFHDVVIDTDSGPAMNLVNSTDIDTTRLSTQTPHPDMPLVASSALPAAAAPK